MIKFLNDGGEITETNEALVQMFIDSCSRLGYYVYYQKPMTFTYPIYQNGKDAEIGLEKGMVHTSVMSGEDAYALLELLREEGFDVNISNRVLEPSKFTVVLDR